MPDVRDRLTPPSRRASRFPGPVLGPVLLPVLVLMLATVLSVLALLVRG